MWVYEKRLQYPVNITQTNAKLAQVIISQFGGPDGELAASQRYLAAKFSSISFRICTLVLLPQMGHSIHLAFIFKFYLSQ